MGATRAKVVIFNDTHGWHSAQLTRALNALDIEVVLSDLADCQINLETSHGFIIPGFDDALPDAAIVRGIAPGSLEQVTLRLDVLHTLAEQNVPVLNPATAIEHTVDKARTSLRLHLAGIPTPRTWACENRQQASQVIHQQLATGKKLVMKPLFGCQGKGIELIEHVEQFESLHPVGEAYYLQEFVPQQQADTWQDWRLFVIDGEVCASMSRHSEHWITNFAQGAQCLPAAISNEMREIAIKATKAVNANYAGVDLICDTEGRYSVLEVNSVPAWKGLQAASNIDVAQYLAAMVNQRITLHNKLPHAF